MSDSSGNRLSGPPPGGPERSPGELEELGRGLVDEVGDGTMTRRELVRRGGLLGLSAVAIGGLLAACGGDDDAAAPAPEPPAPAPEPRARARAGASARTTTRARARTTTRAPSPSRRQRRSCRTRSSSLQAARCSILILTAPMLLMPSR